MSCCLSIAPSERNASKNLVATRFVLPWNFLVIESAPSRISTTGLMFSTWDVAYFIEERRPPALRNDRSIGKKAIFARAMRFSDPYRFFGHEGARFLHINLVSFTTEKRSRNHDNVYT